MYQPKPLPMHNNLTRVEPYTPEDLLLVNRRMSYAAITPELLEAVNTLVAYHNSLVMEPLVSNGDWRVEEGVPDSLICYVSHACHEYRIDHNRHMIPCLKRGRPGEMLVTKQGPSSYASTEGIMMIGYSFRMVCIRESGMLSNMVYFFIAVKVWTRLL